MNQGRPGRPFALQSQFHFDFGVHSTYTTRDAVHGDKSYRTWLKVCLAQLPNLLIESPKLLFVVIDRINDMVPKLEAAVPNACSWSRSCIRSDVRTAVLAISQQS